MRLKDAEAKYKLCRVKSVQRTKKNVPYIVTHDGRTIRYPDPLIKVADTVKVNLETGKITDFIKFDIGVLVMATKGRNTGRVGILSHRERHPGSFDIVHVKDSTGNVFATRSDNVFAIGRDSKPMVTLPKSKGIKMTVLEETRAREEKSKK